MTPKRSRSGVVSRPVRVVAPISVNGGQVERHDARAGALADRDRQLAVLHRGVEGLLERPRQAVDLVDEEDAARLERRQEGGDVALALERRAGGLHERDAPARRRRSARARSCRGRAGRRAARGRAPRRGAAAASMKIASWSLTRSWPTKSASRAGAASGRAPPRRPGGGRAWMRSTPGVRMPLLIGARPAARAAISSSGVSPARLVEQLLGLLGREAEADQALAGERARVVARAATTISSRGLAGDLLAQLHDDPLGGALADARHGLEALRVAGGDRAQQLAGRAAREHRERHLRPHSLHPDQQQEQLALVLAREAVQVHAVVAHDQVRVQERLLRRPRGPA